MLTEKDYCDYETCVALKELGYKGVSRLFYTTKESPLRRYSYDQILTTRIADAAGHTLAISLYVAQKWLREEKRVIIVIVPYTYNIITETSTWTYEIWLEDNLERQVHDFKTYEEALSEGVKEAVKILKEEQDE